MHPNEALFANDAFYLAFAQGDMDSMDDLWADQPQVVCIHPGWAALVSRAEVMASWENILGNAQRPRISCFGATTAKIAGGIAVACYEQLEGSVLVATNIFIEQGGRPRMVLHQAGPCANPPEQDADPPTLNG